MSKYFWQPTGKIPQYPDEAWVKKQIKNQLSILRIWSFMPSAGGYSSKTGHGDFICCSQGMFIAIEAKRADGIWSGQQQDRAHEIERAKGVYIVVDETGLDKLWHFLTQWIYNNYLPQGIHDFRVIKEK